MLAFGPKDGYLYIGAGDGEEAGDLPYYNALNPKSLLGKLLRIDTESGKTPYAIPPSNPYTSNPLLLPEIWATGLRNPWRFSFDRLTGDLWIGDVGQDLWEEIDFQAAGAAGGANYGWSFPVYEYDHSSDCAVQGGYVYRGHRWPGLQGWYIFGDFCSGKIRALQMQNATVTGQVVAQTNFRISSFGEDEQGEIYVADRKGGAVYQLAAGAPSTTAHAVVNAASFGGQSTAGSLASLFGVGLTTVNGASTATEFPLPPVLNGTSVTIDGISAPLLAVEFEGKTQASLVVANNGMASAAVTIPLGVQPGLFAGSRDGTPATGQASTASATLGTVQVLVNGSAATVEYAGLAPGFAGLYQVNARVPASLPMGQISVVLVAGGATSNTLQLGLD